MKFQYRALTKKGVLQTGTVEAETGEKAVARLTGYGLWISQIKKADRLSEANKFHKTDKVLELAVWGTAVLLFAATVLS